MATSYPTSAGQDQQLQSGTTAVGCSIPDEGYGAGMETPFSVHRLKLRNPMSMKTVTWFYILHTDYLCELASTSERLRTQKNHRA